MGVCISLCFLLSHVALLSLRLQSCPIPFHLSHSLVFPFYILSRFLRLPVVLNPSLLLIALGCLMKISFWSAFWLFSENFWVWWIWLWNCLVHLENYVSWMICTWIILKCWVGFFYVHFLISMWWQSTCILNGDITFFCSWHWVRRLIDVVYREFVKDMF